jgi:hypothetical protein
MLGKTGGELQLAIVLADGRAVGVVVDPAAARLLRGYIDDYLEGTTSVEHRCHMQEAR